jgi:hypothetical protein
MPLTSGTSATLHGIYFLDPNEGVAVGDSGTILRTTDGGVPGKVLPAAWEIALDQSRLTGQTEFVLAVPKPSSIRQTRELPGRSAKAAFLVLGSLALRC